MMKRASRRVLYVGRAVTQPGAGGSLLHPLGTRQLAAGFYLLARCARPDAGGAQVEQRRRSARVATSAVEKFGRAGEQFASAVSATDFYGNSWMPL
jgi:hypothetical protein